MQSSAIEDALGNCTVIMPEWNGWRGKGGARMSNTTVDVMDEKRTYILVLVYSNRKGGSCSATAACNLEPSNFHHSIADNQVAPNHVCNHSFTQFFLKSISLWVKFCYIFNAFEELEHVTKFMRQKNYDSKYFSTNFTKNK